MTRKYIVGNRIYEEDSERKVIASNHILEETTAVAPPPTANTFPLLLPKSFSNDVPNVIPRSRNFTNIDGDNINLGNIFSYDKDIPWSTGGLIRWENFSGDERILISKFSNADSSARQLIVESNTSGQIIVVLGGGVRITGTALDLNKWYCVVITNAGTGADDSLKLYTRELKTGRVIDNGVTGTTPFDSSIQDTDVIIGGRDGSGDNMQGDIGHVFLIEGEINAAEINDFCLNPFKTFKKWDGLYRGAGNFYLSDLTRDSSLNGHDVPVNGTTVSVAPPIEFKSDPIIYFIPAPVGAPFPLLLPKQYSPDFSNLTLQVPINPVTVDTDNPLSQGLINYFLPHSNGVLDVVKDKVFPVSIGLSNSVSAINSGGKLVRATADTHQIAVDTIFFPTGSKYTITWLAAKVSAAASTGMIAGNNNDFIWHRSSPSNGIRFRRNAGTSDNDFAITGVLGDELTYRTIVVEGADATYYVNGLSQQTTGTDTTFNMNLLMSGFTSGFDLVGDFQGFIVHNRALTEVEVLELQADPKKMLKPKTPPMYFIPGVIPPITGVWAGIVNGVLNPGKVLIVVANISKIIEVSSS